MTETRSEVMKMPKWKCRVCGYVHEGEEPPGRCPRCRKPKEKFHKISD